MDIRSRTEHDLDALLDVAHTVHQRDGYPPRRAGDLAARFAARRAGLGRRLLERAAAAAHARSRVPILDVAVSLPAAIALYERAGWTRVGTLTAEFGDEPLDEHVYVGPFPE